MKHVCNVTMYFLMLVSFYCGIIGAATPNSNSPEQRVSIGSTDEFMTAFLKSLGDNEKVIYKDGKIAFMQSRSKLTTAMCALGGFAFLGLSAGCACIALNSRRDQGMLVPAGFFGLVGTGLSGCSLYRLVKHFSKEVFIVLDDEGLIERRVRQFSWNKVAKIEIENLRVYNQYGILVSTIKFVYLTDKSGNDLYSLSENDESLPIPLNNFVAVLEHYWNKNKGNV